MSSRRLARGSAHPRDVTARAPTRGKAGMYGSLESKEKNQFTVAY